jgi:NADPH:quinone reductase-like Zn-dependent oxidoreductase
MLRQVRAVVVDPAAPGRLAIKPVELRDPDRDEVAVQVTAISLNRGEMRRAVQQAEPGWRPGWDFVGVVETAAADGSGPRPGTRVVGILPSGAWAERVNCRTHAVAALPNSVGDAEAATLPVAGLTALHALRQGGLLLGRKVLVDGASGGGGLDGASPVATRSNHQTNELLSSSAPPSAHRDISIGEKLCLLYP